MTCSNIWFKTWMGAEEKLRAAYDNMLVNATEIIQADKNAEIKKLELQLAKSNKETNQNEMAIKRELESQDKAWQLNSEKAQLAKTKPHTGGEI